MPSLLAYFAAAGSLASLAQATDAPEPRVVGFPIFKSRRQALANLARRNLARRDTVTATLANYQSLYQINVTVGTPGQRIGLQIDTGSSDVWFPYAGSTQCQEGGCESSFDPEASSTFEDIGKNEFQIQYVDGTSITGDYVRDVLAIGDTKIRNMTMAVARDADDTPEGIMGVGFVQDETLAQTDNQTYPNVPVQLLQQGFISSLAYSLWLNDLGTCPKSPTAKTIANGEQIPAPVTSCLAVLTATSTRETSSACPSSQTRKAARSPRSLSP